ncbi:MAG: hypothetical protein K9N34_08360 [Candidatus Marinimicrobia bacterium]|nr:hypothetical protein [Candidatus Neomarinimicrobiota bacterium]MCF7840613.1 hypothetical protein [Candidatus Neomarinimicrobiota bacterium]MCF7902471.1 hypothetical protein [Candidatus Neomarinimicrobiota bacterium]
MKMNPHTTFNHNFFRLWILTGLLSSVLIQCALPRQSEPEEGPQHRFESAIQAFEEMDREDPAPPGRILFVGSSSIRGWRTLEEDFDEYGVINRGFGGSELPDVLHFFDRVVGPYQPRQIFLYEGDNDVAAGKSPDVIFAHFKIFVEEVRRKLPGTPMVFISIKPSASRKEFIPAMATTNALIKNYCVSQDDLTFVDIFHPMLNESGYPIGEIFKADSLHMNTAGYNLWQSIIAPYLLPEQHP